MLSVVRTLSWAVGLAFAIAISQLPEFAQQYRQRLGGAIDELQRMLVDFDADAASQGMSREQGITRLQNDRDQFVQRRGTRVAETEARLLRLERQQTEFATAGSFGRLRVLLADYDSGMASRTFGAFEPAVPTTFEGLTCAAIGFAAGFVMVRGLSFVSRRRRRARRRIALERSSLEQTSDH